MLKKTFATLVAAASLIGGTAAHASSAQSLSLSNAPAISRAASDAGEGNDLMGLGAGGIVLGAVVAGLAIWGLVEIADDDTPDSP